MSEAQGLAELVSALHLNAAIVGKLPSTFGAGADIAAVMTRAADAIERLRDDLYEIANRAGNMSDDDAADWMPSIYAIACRAVGEDPSHLLDAHNSLPPRLTTPPDDAARSDASKD